MNFESLISIFKEETEKCTSSKTRKFTKKISEGWFTEELHSKIKEQDKKYVQMKYPGCKSFTEEFATLQREVWNSIKFLKKQHYSRRLDECGESNKKKWDTLREMTGQGQKGSTCDKLINNDSLVTEPEEIANK
ncbi:hypothetical protein HHI36_012648 [Cryptolaemus montrouzieri]|uniref:Uncharacterized protein n=1 Tax=Cryptolaemus montrouzieri TaxID=559131 RepID=A0ABD2NF60_9CUCU